MARKSHGTKGGTPNPMDPERWCPQQIHKVVKVNGHIRRQPVGQGTTRTGGPQEAHGKRPRAKPRRTQPNPEHAPGTEASSRHQRKHRAAGAARGANTRPSHSQHRHRHTGDQDARSASNTESEATSPGPILNLMNARPREPAPTRMAALGPPRAKTPRGNRGRGGTTALRNDRNWAAAARGSQARAPQGGVQWRSPCAAPHALLK